ncbi:MAG: TetR/AcrR family transcriptional regulator [Aeromicrobium sp.]
MTAVTARQRLLDAAVEAFAEKGFTATTTRDIASRAGMSPAAVYVHHDSKESLLFAVSLTGHQASLEVITAAATTYDDPGERVRHMVYDFTKWHADNSRVGRIVQYEFHALTPEHRAKIALLRRSIEKCMQDALTEGVGKGVFDVDDIAGTSLALLSLAVDLVRWFVPGGPRKAEDIAELYAGLAVKMTAA